MKHSLIFFVLFIALSCAAQQNQINTLPRVVVTDWGKKSFAVNETFWAEVKDELVNQVGSAKFEEIKKYSENRNKPLALLIWDGKTRIRLPEYSNRMNTLSLFKIATCKRTYNGEIKNYTILSVPDQKLFWDTAAKWNVVYFIVRSEAIEYAKK
jgi:hypothetical protein